MENNGSGENKRRCPEHEDKRQEQPMEDRDVIGHFGRARGRAKGPPENKRPRSPSPETVFALSKTKLSLEQLGFATYSQIESICIEAELTATESARVKHAIWIKTWSSRLGSNNLYEF